MYILRSYNSERHTNKMTNDFWQGKTKSQIASLVIQAKGYIMCIIIAFTETHLKCMPIFKFIHLGSASAIQIISLVIIVYALLQFLKKSWGSIRCRNIVTGRLTEKLKNYTDIRDWRFYHLFCFLHCQCIYLRSNMSGCFRKHQTSYLGRSSCTRASILP